jgi:hypothetical protein
MDTKVEIKSSKTLNQFTMKSRNTPLLIVILLIIVLSSCKKEDTTQIDDIIINDEFIEAGVTEGANYFLYADSLFGTTNLDLDEDGNYDIQFKMDQSSFCGGEITAMWAKVIPYSHVEICLDSLNDSIQTPQLIEKGTLIDETAMWKDSSEFTLSQFFPLGWEDCNPDGYYSFWNWTNKQEDYMGFRIKSKSETKYGWMRIEVQSWVLPWGRICVITNDYAIK